MAGIDASPPRGLEVLREIELFQGLRPNELGKVAGAAQERRFQSGAFLYFQDDPADHLHVLIEGSVKLTQLTPEGQQVILRYASPGEAFAVVAVLSNMRYPVSAEAAEDSLTMVWGREIMKEMMMQHPQLALNALQVLARRTREFQDRVRELSTERVERRIARALLRLARQTGRKVSEGVLIEMPLSRQDLAEMTGTTLYTVSRTLSKWESRGIVKSKREQVTILFPHGLVTIAEDLPADKTGGLEDW
jgi:CRP-like cAMP-binding protein